MTDEIKKKFLLNENIKMIYLGIPLRDGRDTKSLASILEKEVPKKYFLSEKIQQRLKLWEQQSQTKESGKEMLFMGQMDWGGALEATSYKQPPQILVHNMQPRSADRPSLQYSKGGSGHLMRNDGITYTVDTGNTNAIKVLNKGESQHYRLYDTEGLAPTLQSQSGMSSQKHPFVVAQRGRNPQNPKSRKSGLKTEQILEANLTGNSNTLTGVEKDNYVFDGQVRKLMPIECERLMSWSDDWTRWGMDEKGNKVEISDSQRYKMCGNGVVSAVVKELIKIL